MEYFSIVVKYRQTKHWIQNVFLVKAATIGQDEGYSVGCNWEHQFYTLPWSLDLLVMIRNSYSKTLQKRSNRATNEQSDDEKCRKLVSQICLGGEKKVNDGFSRAERRNPDACIKSRKGPMQVLRKEVDSPATLNNLCGQPREMGKMSFFTSHYN